MTGLVLEGGAMRGLFSAGVLDVFMEEGLRFDSVMGVSAGAAFGCNYKSQQPGRVIRYNTRYSRDWRYCSFRSLFATGDLYGANFCYRLLPNELDPFDNDTFNSNPSAFWVVCTDVETGEAVYRRCDRAGDECSDWIRASASMPLVSRVVRLEGRGYLDGGIADSIPLRALEERGCERNVVILTQPEGFVKEPASGMGLMRLALRKYPRVLEAVESRHIRYNEALDYVRRREAESDALVICPKEKLLISRVEHDAQKMRLAYELGRDAALERLEEIKAFVNA